MGGKERHCLRAHTAACAPPSPHGAPICSQGGGGLTSLFVSAYQPRYAVIYPPDAALYYFDSRADRLTAENPRIVPLTRVFEVEQVGARTARRGAAAVSLSMLRAARQPPPN